MPPTDTTWYRMLLLSFLKPVGILFGARFFPLFLFEKVKCVSGFYENVDWSAFFKTTLWIERNDLNKRTEN